MKDFWVEAAPGIDAWVKVQMNRESPTVVEVRISARGKPITTQVWRSIPIGEVTETARLAASPLGAVRDDLADGWGPAGRGGLSDGQYAKLADAYRALQRSGTRRPAKLLAEAMGCPIGTAHTRLTVARKRGLL